MVGRADARQPPGDMPPGAVTRRASAVQAAGRPGVRLHCTGSEFRQGTDRRGKRTCIMTPSRTRRTVLSRLALGAAITFALSLPASAMTQPNKVFHDPLVVDLAFACMEGDMSRIAALLKQGANVRAVGELGMTVPQFALRARKNAPQVMKAILDAGGDPVSVLYDGNTLPVYAVSRDNADPEVVKVILDHGISPNWHPPKPPYERTSLLIKAISGHNRPVVRLLLERGADVNYVDGFTGSALHHAMFTYDFGLCADLVNAGIRLDLVDNTHPDIKTNPLHLTALERYCKHEGGKHGANPLPEIAAGWKELTAALARRGATMPCAL
jgi:hypothetical protein